MELEWMKKHRSLVEKMIKFGNAYAAIYKLQRDYNTGVSFSASQIQALEYILESEDKNEKMSEMAKRLGVSRSTFSKNVNNLMEKGLLEKYQFSDNRKDIYVKPSEKGREVYQAYTAFVCSECFDELFSLADDISVEDEAQFGKILDCFADSMLWYSKQENKSKTLIKIE